VEETLAALNIAGLAERPPHMLSFGQKKRVAIAGAVAMRPDVLLMDEPTAGLDHHGSVYLLSALKKLEAWFSPSCPSDRLSSEPLLGWADAAGLAKDFENLTRIALAFVKLASIRFIGQTLTGGECENPRPRLRVWWQVQ
jgi:hypothetical protein